VGRRTEAEQSHALAALHAGYAQAPESDDTSAEQGRGFEIVESGRQGNREAGARYGELGVTAIHGVSGENR
jgi:hypothetical protein